jgi:hypothetical protein
VTHRMCCLTWVPPLFVQKFINPIVEIRCAKSNSTLFKIEKEGVRERIRISPL